MITHVIDMLNEALDGVGCVKNYISEALTEDLRNNIHRLKEEYTDNPIKVKTAYLMYEGKI